MNKTILNGEVTAKNEYVQDPPPQYQLQGYPQFVPQMGVITLPAPEAKRQLMTVLTIKLDGFTKADEAASLASGGGLEGSIQININSVEAMDFLRAGTRISLTIESAGSDALLQALKSSRALKPAAQKIERPDDITFIRPNETWRGEDGKAQTAADQAQRDPMF